MRQAKKRNRRWWLLGIPFAVVLLWLIGVGVFRQAVPRPAAIASSAPPAALHSAEDYLAQGDYDFEQEKYAQAIADYSRAIELKPNSARAYNNRAYTYMVLENYAAALPDLDRAIALRPDYVNALMNRGDIYNYYYQIDYQRAVTDYDRVLQVDPDAPQHTSVCGHRLLALNHGWSPAVFGELLTRGTESGCPPRQAE